MDVINDRKVGESYVTPQLPVKEIDDVEQAVLWDPTLDFDGLINDSTSHFPNVLCH